MKNTTTELYDEMRREANKCISIAVKVMGMNSYNGKVEKSLAKALLDKLTSDLDLIMLRYGVLKYEEAFRYAGYREVKREQTLNSLAHKIDIISNAFFDCISYVISEEWVCLEDKEEVKEV